MRLIDADKLKQHFAWWHEGGEEADRQAEIFEQIIDAQPTAQPKMGKWIRHPEVKNIYGGTYIECSECGEEYVVQHMEDEKFCRNCGARMEVDDAGDL